MGHFARDFATVTIRDCVTDVSFLRIFPDQCLSLPHISILESCHYLTSPQMPNSTSQMSSHQYVEGYLLYPIMK
jgi:hypothetical protein